MNVSARDARRAYLREWRRKNPDKVRAATERYWERRAAKLSAEAEEQAREEDKTDENLPEHH